MRITGLRGKYPHRVAGQKFMKEQGASHCEETGPRIMKCNNGYGREKRRRERKGGKQAPTHFNSEGNTHTDCARGWGADLIAVLYEEITKQQKAGWSWAEGAGGVWHPVQTVQYGRVRLSAGDIRLTCLCKRFHNEVTTTR